MGSIASSEEEDSSEDEKGQEQSGHEETISNYWYTKRGGLENEQKRFMGPYYESEHSRMLNMPKWAPTLNLLELEQAKTTEGAMWSLEQCMKMELWKEATIPERIELINWIAFLRDWVLREAAKVSSITNPTAADANVRRANEAYHMVVGEFMKLSEKDEVAEYIRENENAPQQPIPK